ncbi:MAG: hypothetical protein QXH57_05140 [Sulfolobales archaeon]
MTTKFKVVDNGDLTINLTLLYILLRKGALLRGPFLYLDVQPTDIEKLLNEVLNSSGPKIPTVNFCPHDEPIRIYDVDDVLGQLCLEVYRYFNDRCLACAIKVYSILSENWLVSEELLIKIFEKIIKYELPAEFNNGSIVVTTCPTNYEDASKLIPGAYVDGINMLKNFIREVLS